VVSTDSQGNVFTSNGPSTDISPTPGEIDPAFVTASVANGVVSSATTPLPGAVWAGGLTLLILGGGMWMRRRAGARA